MSWGKINQQISAVRDEFNRTLKCISKENLPKRSTCNKHIATLVAEHNKLVTICEAHLETLDTNHKEYIIDIFLKVKNKLNQILEKFNIEERPSDSFFEFFHLSQLDCDIEIEKDLSIKFHSLTIEEPKMSQSITEFLSSAAKILPEFDGKAENLQSFIDALNILDMIKDNHEAVAVTLIKTKLKGASRHLITNQNTITDIIQKLKASVKSESTEVLSAKLLSIKHNKNTNAVVKEIEEITNLLQTAYISEGLPTEVAAKYSTQIAVKSLIKNAPNERSKLIMEAGQFKSLGEAVTKYISTVQEVSSSSNVFFTNRSFHGSYNNRGNRFGKYNRSYRGRNNNNYRNNSNNNYNNRDRFPSNNARNYTNNNTNHYNTRPCETNQGNSGTPLRETGEQL